MSLQVYLEQRSEAIGKQEALITKCSTDKRNLTTEEKEEFDKLDTEIVNLEATIERLKAFKNTQDKTFEGAKTLEAGFVPKPEDKEKEPKNAFGQVLQATAIKAGKIITGVDNNDVMNAASGHSANVPSEGGFLISPERSSEVWQKMYEGGEILGRCATYEIGANSDSLEVPYLDETSRANGSRWGGLRAYREGEVDTPTSSKTKLGLWECRLEDIKALVYVTDRLMQDATALQSLVEEQLDKEFTFKIEDELLNGSGANQCKGVVADTATVSVAKETGQAAATILAENIIKMYCRCWGRSRKNAAWFINQDIEPELMTMALSVGTGGVPVFMPANGLSTSPYSTLFGKPIVPVEACQTLGTVGDIVLGDFNEYAVIKKGGLNQASSIHVKFVENEMCFRFIMRVNGKPKWNNVLTPFKGTNTLAPFVTLATRA